MHDSMPKEQIVPKFVAAFEPHCACFVCSRKRLSLKKNGKHCLFCCYRYSQSWQAIHLLSLYQTQTGGTVQQMVTPQQTWTHHGELGLYAISRQHIKHCRQHPCHCICFVTADDPRLVLACAASCLSALRFTISFAHDCPSGVVNLPFVESKKSCRSMSCSASYSCACKIISSCKTHHK